MNGTLKKLAADPSLALRCSQIVVENDSEQSKSNYRNKFMSDRDRILYCKAFLRLSGKTQVYAPSDGDHQRTRLTHTLEVSQIARTIAKTLDLDCDLTEAIALGHDIGHTPFGHAGERMLHEILSPINDKDAQTPKTTSVYKLNSRLSQKAYQQYYGFKHNLQSVRFIVEDLEAKSDQFGLDLTNYTLWGIIHHSSVEYKEGKVSSNYTYPAFYERYMKYCKKSYNSEKDAWSFEALVVAEADEIAQMHHDLEDAIRRKAMSYEKVLDLVTKLEPLMDQYDLQILNDLKSDIISKEHLINNISKIVVNTLVTTIINASEKNLTTLLSNNSRSVIFDMSAEDKLIKNSIQYDEYGNDDNFNIIKQFKSELSKSVLYTYDVQRSDSKGKYIIKNLFEAYYTNPQQLPNSVMKNLFKTLTEEGYEIKISEPYYSADHSTLRQAIEIAIEEIKSKKDIKNDIFVMRVICDYIAGMTDKFAISEYEKLYG